MIGIDTECSEISLSLHSRVQQRAKGNIIEELFHTTEFEEREFKGGIDGLCVRDEYTGNGCGVGIKCRKSSLW